MLQIDEGVSCFWIHKIQALKFLFLLTKTLDKSWSVLRFECLI